MWDFQVKFHTGKNLPFPVIPECCYRGSSVWQCAVLKNVPAFAGKRAENIPGEVVVAKAFIVPGTPPSLG